MLSIIFQVLDGFTPVQKRVLKRGKNWETPPIVLLQNPPRNLAVKNVLF